jgi:methionine synthase II (cobalamin-independent)
MKRSTGRIVTTHVGSLIRPARLLEFVRARKNSEAVDEQAGHVAQSRS